MTEVSGKIKALEWEEDDTGWWGTVSHIGISYEVRQTKSGSVRIRISNENFRFFYGTVEEAKAVAQADYERRVRAAIEAPSADPVAERCPDCGRPKAHSAGDAARGDCPKWWAVRDGMAEQDCKNHAAPPSDARVQELVEALEWALGELEARGGRDENDFAPPEYRLARAALARYQEGSNDVS